MTVTVLFFASLREKTRQRSLELPLEKPSSLRELARRLEETFAGLSLSGSLCAINEQYAEPESLVKAGDTVAFFPPVSGG
jgi:molybdopterin converting factor subunit 1